MRAVAPLVCALLLLVPGTAVAQTTPDALGDAPPLVGAPPVAPAEPEDGGTDEGAGQGNGDGTDRTPPAESGELPDTGLDAWVVALLGLGLVVSGLGLRLRSIDERF